MKKLITAICLVFVAGCFLQDRRRYRDFYFEWEYRSNVDSTLVVDTIGYTLECTHHGVGTVVGTTATGLMQEQVAASWFDSNELTNNSVLLQAALVLNGNTILDTSFLWDELSFVAESQGDKRDRHANYQTFYLP